MKRVRGLCGLLLIVTILLTLGCATRQTATASRDDETVLRYAAGESAPAQPVPGAQSVEAESGKYEAASLPGAAQIERKIIYNVTLNLVVKDTDESLAELEHVTQEMGGFVAHSNVWRTEGYRQANVTVRVPADKLNDALAQYRALALDIENESLDSSDVTADYVNLEADLKNEQRTEVELQELLETRSETGRTEDILEVHRELSTVRAEIERIQGQMRYLDNLSDMATVQITLTPDELLQPIEVGGWKPQGTARDAIRMLLRTLQFFADAGIVFVLYILPTLIVIAIPVVILVLLIRAIWRRVRRRRRSRAEQ
jgi:hypothetical protein